MSKQMMPPSDSKKETLFFGSTDGEVTLNFSIRFEDLTFSESDLLGQGGYGKVYKGEWQFNTVAIKQYTAQDFSDKTKAEIRKEAQVMATASTQSDYLVRLRGMILEKPHYLLVMEYLPGGDLFHLLKSSQEITWPMRYRLGLDMTIGLHHLHEHNILHRDLKSLNVLLDLNGRAKLADFGLSTLKTSSSSTSAGEFKGTVLWSAPELFKRGAKATIAADIYSLGMILWELVSRQIPFADAASAAIAASWIERGDQEIVPKDTPDEFKELILNCWHKEPAQRPKASDVAKRLNALWKAEQKKLPAVTAMGHTTRTGSTSGSLPGVWEYGAQSGKPLLAKLDSSTPDGLQATKPPMKEDLLQLRNEIEQLKLKQAQVSTAPVTQQEVNKLLRLVAEGEQDQAEEMIKDNPNLLLAAGTVTDLSSREFKQITAFQYALWALDWHMWKMIQKYLPLTAQIKQFDALESKGTPHGKYFSLDLLINALQKYADNAEKVWKYDKRAQTHWQTVVGKAQRLLPAHVINEYCRPDRSFSPCPQFTEETLPRTRAFYDKSDWFTKQYNGGVLGKKFAAVRGSSSGCDVEAMVGVATGKCDLHSLQSLFNIRVQQLELLSSQFKPVSPILILNTTPLEELKKPILLTSQNIYALTASKPRTKWVDQKAVNTLLRLVAEGEQDQVEKIIKTNRSLLLTSGIVTDLSGREFKQITAFQYALWALDWHMWKMIQKYLPTEAQAEQFEALESKGTAHGKCFSLIPLIDALGMYIDKYASWSWGKRANHWQKVVGGAQKHLPAHVINEYCRRDRSFDPCPQFSEATLPRSREVYEGESRLSNKNEWFNAVYNGGKLGDKFGVRRAKFTAVGMDGMAFDSRNHEAARQHLQAVQSLSKTRIQQWELLKSQLKSSSSVGLKSEWLSEQLSLRTA